jgi:hypothetical protein
VSSWPESRAGHGYRKLDSGFRRKDVVCRHYDLSNVRPSANPTSQVFSGFVQKELLPRRVR